MKHTPTPKEEAAALIEKYGKQQAMTIARTNIAMQDDEQAKIWGEIYKHLIGVN